MPCKCGSDFSSEYRCICDGVDRALFWSGLYLYGVPALIVALLVLALTARRAPERPPTEDLLPRGDVLRVGGAKARRPHIGEPPRYGESAAVGPARPPDSEAEAW